LFVLSIHRVIPLIEDRGRTSIAKFPPLGGADGALSASQLRCSMEHTGT
jgi:hypothetical protein